MFPITKASNEKQALTKSPNNNKLIVIIILVGILISAIIIAGNSMTNLFPKETSSQEPEGTTLTLALYQAGNYSHQGTEYELRYVSAGQGNLLLVSSEGQTQSYAAAAGATYIPWNLKITIISATENMIVLHVTPL
jgi:hypothetical protein